MSADEINIVSLTYIKMVRLMKEKLLRRTSWQN